MNDNVDLDIAVLRRFGTRGTSHFVAAATTRRLKELVMSEPGAHVDHTTLPLCTDAATLIENLCLFGYGSKPNADGRGVSAVVRRRRPVGILPQHVRNRQFRGGARQR